MASAAFTAVPINDVGVYNILSVAHVGWCPVCYYFSPTYLLGPAALLSLPALLAYNFPPLCQSVFLYCLLQKKAIEKLTFGSFLRSLA